MHLTSWPAKKIIPVIVPLLLILSGCGGNKLDVDISEIQTTPLKLQRLDQDLFTLNEKNLLDATGDLLKRYGPYYEHYIMYFLARNGTCDSAYAGSLLSFISDRDVSQSHLYTRKLYPDEYLLELKKEVDKCVKRFHYHFPQRPLPSRLITCISGWNYAFSYMDSALVVSLDMYLGDTAKFYQMLRYPQYMTRKMNRDYLLSDIARGWLLTEFDNKEAGNTLLDHMIFYGKIYYGVNALLPDERDSVIIGYTNEQMQYCQQYEKNLWGYFAEKNRLYETSLDNLRELTSEGPFSGAISKECPPRIGMWVGWQIVKSYMKNNPEQTLARLMKESDAKKILNKSRYRP